MIENTALLRSLSEKYTREGLDILQALRSWKESRLSPESIREQVRFDVGIRISSAESHDLHKAGSMIKNHGFSLQDFGISEESHSNLVPKGALSSRYSKKDKDWAGAEVKVNDYEVSQGRSELLPDNIVNRDKMKFTPSVRMSMHKVDHNLYRSKTAAKYWTMKEKLSENGTKEVFLVAVNDDPEELERKEAQYFPGERQKLAESTPETDQTNTIEPTPAPEDTAVNETPTEPVEPAQNTEAPTTDSSTVESPESPSIETTDQTKDTPDQTDLNTEGDVPVISDPNEMTSTLNDIFQRGNQEELMALKAMVGEDQFNYLSKYFNEINNLGIEDVVNYMNQAEMNEV